MDSRKRIKDNVDLLDKKKCFGCGACANVCPLHIITMEYDDEGFLEPTVNGDKCINCGLCTRVCSAMNPRYGNKGEPECYAYKAADEIREVSSSGGAFTTLAQKTIDEKGFVVGSVLTEELYAEHIVTNKSDDIEKMRGSKYIQSNTKSTYAETKKLLQDEKQVLYTGTPCQIAGLYGYLGRDYDGLTTVDILCHGTPSVKSFHKYLDELWGIENIETVNFRTKSYGYNCTNQEVVLKNGQVEPRNISYDFYEKGMHSGILCKKLCGDCPYASEPRQADISIGDFWGISKYDESLADDKGTSLVLINSQKGKKFWEEIKGRGINTKQVPYNFAKNNNRLSDKMNIPNGRDWFFHMLKTQPYQKSVEYALKRKFDVGIVGLWYGRNYGSMATYFALHYVLKEMFGLSVVMVENSLKPSSEQKIYTSPRRVAEKFYDVTRQYKISDLPILNGSCDTFIVGSDQLWNVGLSRPYQQTYFLEFAGDDTKKISYATSFGHDYRGTKREAMITGHNLKRFDHISVRDDFSKEICENNWGIDAKQNCDPTWLCGREAYDILVGDAKINVEEDYILAYILDPNEEIGQVLSTISIQKNIKVYVILDEYSPRWEDNKNKLGKLADGVCFAPNIGVEEWILYYKGAKAVVTDSMHGTIFAMIYEKPFETLSNKGRGAERFQSLLNPLGMQYRLFEDIHTLQENMDLLDGCDYTYANEQIDLMKDDSLEWLKNSIFAPKKIQSKKVFDVIS